MHASSPSSQEDDSDAMFPTPNDPSSSHATYGEGLARELSPPHSQDAAQPDGDEPMDLTGTRGMEEGGGADGDKSVPMKLSEANQEPGASWNNPKAREEYKRAFSQLQDKKFSLSECEKTG